MFNSRPLSWCDYVEQRLHDELGTERERRIIRLECETGRAQIRETDDVIFIYRIEQSIDTSQEFVIVALAGKNVREFADALATWCYERGIPRIRFHSRHDPELQSRFMPRHLPGFERLENVYVREVLH